MAGGNDGPIYDITAKDLLGERPQVMMEIVAGGPVDHFLTAEFNRTERRVADMVARLKDGTIRHVEIQTRPDRRMPWRMLEYRSLIAQQHPGILVQQTVLYLGTGGPSMNAGIEEPNLSFGYGMVDMMDVSPARLLTSDSPADMAMSILCRVDEPDAATEYHQRARTVLQRLASRLDRVALERVATQMAILAGLRGVEAMIAIEKEAGSMGIQLDASEHPLLNRVRQDGVAEGHTLGAADTLRNIITRKFGDVPDWLDERIAAAKEAQVNDWVFEFVEGSTFEQVFGRPIDGMKM